MRIVKNHKIQNFQNYKNEINPIHRGSGELLMIQSWSGIHSYVLSFSAEYNNPAETDRESDRGIGPGSGSGPTPSPFRDRGIYIPTD